MRALLVIVAMSVGASTLADYKIETVAENLNFPWSVAFLPDESYLVALRVGEVRRISKEGEISDPIIGFPPSFVESQGGYFDVVLDPQFEINQLIYLSFAHGSNEKNGTRIVRGVLTEKSIENLETIFTVSPEKDTPVHYGGKMLFLDDATLLMTTGDGFEYREASQDRFSHLGKIIRINRDGSVPADNPFSNGEKGDPRIWTYGHRNPQGLALDKSSGTVYMHEHGAQGGDELNRVIPSKNYGWPAVTRGVNYSGAYITPLTSDPLVSEPLTFWIPSIAPSGLAVYQGEAFPEWSGNLFVGALVDKEVRKIEIEFGKVVSEQSVFTEVGERIRDVRVGPDGFLYLLTDSDKGKLLRISPD